MAHSRHPEWWMGALFPCPSLGLIYFIPKVMIWREKDNLIYWTDPRLIGALAYQCLIASQFTGQTHVKAPVGGTLSIALFQAYRFLGTPQDNVISLSPEGQRWVCQRQSQSKPLRVTGPTPGWHSTHSASCIRIPLGPCLLKHRLLDPSPPSIS